jgi:hypothetical protein
MSTDSSAPHDAPGGSPSTQAALQSQTEFLWQVLKETANGLMKAVAFYFAMSAAILAYVLSHSLAPSLRITALWVIISITLLFTIAFVSVSWGFWTGMRDLRSAQEKLSPGAFAQLELHRFFARTRVVFLITITTLLLSLVILLAAIGCSLSNSP